jgi:hypothetical protein
MNRLPLVSVLSTRALADRLGLGASAVCLVHCLVLPFVLTGTAALSGGAHHGFHAAVLALTLPLALWAALPGYREHRDRRVPALLGLGTLLLVASFAVHDLVGEAGHAGLTVAGSVTLMAGHLRNYRRRAQCAAHTLPHHRAHHSE